MNRSGELASGWGDKMQETRIMRKWVRGSINE